MSIESTEVLIIDDSRTDAELAMHALRRDGPSPSVTWLSSGEDVDRHLRELGNQRNRVQLPDLVLLEIDVREAAAYVLGAEAQRSQLSDYDQLRPPGSEVSLHATALLIDQHTVFVGGYNLDPRSPGSIVTGRTCRERDPWRGPEGHLRGCELTLERQGRKGVHSDRG